MYLNKINGLCLIVLLSCVNSAFGDELLNLPATQMEWQAVQEKTTHEAYEVIQNNSTEESRMPTPPMTSQIKDFPIITKAMTPGALIANKQAPISFMQPIFILGTDELSKQWLQQKHAQLQASHAIGFLIQAQNQAEVDEMKQLAAGLLLITASGDIFARKLKLEHYPVLLTRAGIVQ